MMGKGERAERLRRLCKGIITNNPHNVDDGTKAAFKAAVLRYAGAQYIDTTQALENIYQGETEISHAFAVIDKRQLVRSPVSGAFYPADEDYLEDDDDRDLEVDDENDDDAVEKADHYASTIADLLVEAGSFPHRAAALHHLLHKPYGQALLARMHKKESPM